MPSFQLKILGLFIFQAILSPAMAKDPPKVLAAYLKEGVTTRGLVVAVVPPKEIQKYMLKVQESAKADPEWFTEYNKQTKPGIPLPFHDKLGLSQEEYADYLVLWGQRTMEPVPDGEVALKLESPKEGEWVVRATGAGTPVSILRYDTKKDVMVSPNGVLSRLEDIAAEAESVLGEWTGHEWKFEEEGGMLGKTKENFAIGKTASGEFGLLVYRLQEVSTEGRVTYDRRLLIRFPLAVK